MKTSWLIYLLFVGILNSFPQDYIEPVHLFTLNADYFVGYSTEIRGARAIEYFEGNLYVAFENLILKTDLNGNILSKIDPKVQGGADRIMDMAILNGKIYAYTPPYLIRIIDNEKISNKFRVNFYGSDPSNPRAKSILLTYKPKYIFNLLGNLYFSNGYEHIKLSDLTPTKVVGDEYYGDSDVYLNVNQITPKIELPLSDCEDLIARNFNKTHEMLYFKIKNSCTNNSFEEFITIPSMDTEKYFFSVITLIPNNYIPELYIIGAIENRLTKEINFSLLFLNKNLEIEKVASNINIYKSWEGYPSPDFNSCFTYDELGNIYYCTNKYDFDSPEKSTLIVHKILSLK